MPSTKEDLVISAVKAVYAALGPLEPQDRDRVLNSVRVLFGITQSEPSISPFLPVQHSQPTSSSSQSSSRPVSLVELIKDKQPKTHVDLITLFAFYRDQVEGVQRFGRNDLKAYFSLAKQNPPSNFDRDFVKAVKRGWLHEDGEDSYITSRGMEAIASGFPGDVVTSKRKPASRGATSRKKATPKRRA